MEGYFPMRLKRKDVEDVSEDFSEFSLSSPARKIRRLDAELPPIIEEEECEIPIQSFVSNYSGGIKIEELPNDPINEERAIVLFKPVNANPLLQSPSNFSVSPNLISGFKNQVRLSSQSNSWKPTSDEEAEKDHSRVGNGCLAVVPWVPSQLPSALRAEESFPQVDNCEMLDAEESTMDVEDSPSIIDQGNVDSSDGSCLGQQFHQWQQQHCLLPQLPQNSTAPIIWYR